MSQILMIILHERAVILLARPEVSALRISTLAKNKILIQPLGPSLATRT